jgi:Putative prokaryotic signal transducing protein
MEENDKIVLLRTFDLAIDANLAKTKLDARGIPCFLTNENMANVYVLPVNPLFGVRLMVFKNDLDNAKEILSDQPESNRSSCPHCKSKNISFQFTRSVPKRLVTILSGLFLGILFPVQKFRCADCGKEFDQPENF